MPLSRSGQHTGLACELVKRTDGVESLGVQLESAHSGLAASAAERRLFQHGCMRPEGLRHWWSTEDCAHAFWPAQQTMAESDVVDLGFRGH